MAIDFRIDYIEFLVGGVIIAVTSLWLFLADVWHYFKRRRWEDLLEEKENE